MFVWSHQFDTFFSLNSAPSQVINGYRLQIDIAPVADKVLRFLPKYKQLSLSCIIWINKVNVKVELSNYQIMNFRMNPP